MAKCAECRIKYDDTQNFCFWCGSPLAKSGFLKFSAKNENSFYERGIIHSLRGDLRKAKKELETLLKLNRRDADAYYQLGKIYEEMGQQKKALKLYSRCMKYDEDKKWEADVLPKIKKIKR